MIEWQPVADAQPREFETYLAYVPHTREEFESYHVVTFARDGWRIQDDKLYIAPSHVALLSRP